MLSPGQVLARLKLSNSDELNTGTTTTTMSQLVKAHLFTVFDDSEIDSCRKLITAIISMVIADLSYNVSYQTDSHLPQPGILQPHL